MFSQTWKSLSNVTVCFNQDPFKHERKLLQNEIFELKRRVMQAESKQSTEMIILNNRVEMFKKENEDLREWVSDQRDRHESEIKDA